MLEQRWGLIAPNEFVLLLELMISGCQKLKSDGRENLLLTGQS